ncbi:MAG: hypothetical protein COT45_01670 [bacterium (Candidatus Stahlbacteria) CG08_land_8_20_14_0_20_40_26]|nr:MAG: hypothetical protein COT45_01670 [bacterium (Candidatus Stahlbacteria) CG08_land_8_20_14_0_20_40_26]
MSLFTPQERRIIYILIGIIAIGSSIYFYKLRNPFFAPELDRAILEMNYQEEGIDSLIKLSASASNVKRNTSPKEKDKIPTGGININTANKKELMLLPGIGPVYADRIVEYRKEKGELKDIEEIKNIKGIGEKRFEELKDKIKVE